MRGSTMIMQKTKSINIIAIVPALMLLIAKGAEKTASVWNRTFIKLSAIFAVVVGAVSGASAEMVTTAIGFLGDMVHSRPASDGSDTDTWAFVSVDALVLLAALGTIGVLWMIVAWFQRATNRTTMVAKKHS